MDFQYGGLWCNSKEHPTDDPDYFFFSLCQASSYYSISLPLYYIIKILVFFTQLQRIYWMLFVVIVWQSFGVLFGMAINASY